MNINKNISKIRSVISSLLLITFLVVFVTGILLAINRTDKLAKLHTIIGFIFSGLIFIHLFFNYKLFVFELKSLFKKKKGYKRNSGIYF